MAALTDADAIIVSTTSMASDDETAVVQSNISVVNALFGELLRAGEIEADALRSYYVDYFYAQLMNGGFSQFVYNSRWSPAVIEYVKTGLTAMGATAELAAFQKGARFVHQAGEPWREKFLATDYFGANLYRDTYNDALDHKPFTQLPAVNGRWLRAHPRLVVVTIDEMAAEIARRGAALPDRAARIAAARAAESRDLKLIRALCERAGHAFDRRTAAARRTYEGEALWAFFFVTDRGPHFMIDLGTRALMFANTRQDVIDPATVIAEIQANPE